MIYNAFTTIITLIGALILSVNNAANTILIIGCITSVAIIILLDYMRGRVGLRIDSYRTEDLKYSTIKQEMGEK